MHCTQAAGPLTPGKSLPTLDATSLVALGAPKFRVTLLPSPGGPTAAASKGPPAGGPQGEHGPLGKQLAMASRLLAPSMGMGRYATMGSPSSCAGP